MGNEERQKWEASKREVRRIFTEADTIMPSKNDMDGVVALVRGTTKALHLGLTACQQLIKVGEYDSNGVINPKDARRIIRSITGGK